MLSIELTNTAPKRLDALTGLRWWAAFGVFLFHMRVFAPLPYSGPAAGLGDHGVTFFFVLSGFVLAWSFKPSTRLRVFWWRRFARIHPLHIVTLVLAIPVFYFLAVSSGQHWAKPLDAVVLILSVFLLQGWSRNPDVLFAGNPAAWTLTVEYFFYALFPFLNRVARALKRNWLVLAFWGLMTGTLLFGVAAKSFIDLQWLLQLPLPVLRLSQFVLGILLALLVMSGWRLRIPNPIMFVSAGLFLLFIAYSDKITGSDSPTLFQQFSSEIVVLICVLIIAVTASNDLEGKPSWLKMSIQVRLGEYSYAFYLVHATVMYTCYAIWGRQETAWTNLIWHGVVLCVALVLAALLNTAIEKPAERRLRKWADTWR